VKAGWQICSYASELVSPPAVVIVCPLGRTLDQWVVSSVGRAGDS
jgi:hypothetical protein